MLQNMANSTVLRPYIYIYTYICSYLEQVSQGRLPTVGPMNPIFLESFSPATGSDSHSLYRALAKEVVLSKRRTI